MSSTYMWGTLNPGMTAEGNGKVGDQSNSGRIVGNTGLYEDETLAYNVMWEQTISLEVETSAWLTKDGVLLMPVEYPGGQKNAIDNSENMFYRITVFGKTQYVHYNGKRIELLGQIHTHPRDGNFGDRDREVMKTLLGKPMYAFGRNNLYKGFHIGKDLYYINPIGNAQRLYYRYCRWHYIF